jgi:hypothetical protein
MRLRSLWLPHERKVRKPEPDPHHNQDKTRKLEDALAFGRKHIWISGPSQSQPGEAKKAQETVPSCIHPAVDLIVFKRFLHSPIRNVST